MKDMCLLTISFHLVLFTSLIESGVDLVMMFLKEALKTEWLGRINSGGAQM